MEQLNLTDPGASDHNLAKGMTEDTYKRILGLAIDAGNAFRKEQLQDQAILSNPGGIDFNSDKMNLDLEMDSSFRGNDRGIQFHIDPVMLQQLQNASGFVPAIINIQPLKDLPSFLGTNANFQ